MYLRSADLSVIRRSEDTFEDHYSSEDDFEDNEAIDQGLYPQWLPPFKLSFGN